MQTTTPLLQLAADYVQYTGQHIFLTGKAGTGKTTFLHRLREMSPKRMVVVAPTGVAAINAHGVTIHSFFQLPFGPIVGTERMKSEQMRFSREKINIIRSLDLLVIDEISMVRADLLDGIDYVLRRFRTHSKPFGGVQLLMIGDLQQLSPVVKDDEHELLQQYYSTPYFFSSRALGETSFVSIELTHVYRQQDDLFISVLNKVRENRMDQAALEVLNKRYLPGFSPKEDEGYITLCTHNWQAKQINGSKLNALPGKEHRFTAKVTGHFPEYSFPTDLELLVKENAQVMFAKNDASPEKRFFNGKIGKITRIDGDIIHVHCPGDDSEIAVTPVVWENIKYSIDETTNAISEEVDGSFTQYPLKLAWAITIHKSQGLTFERAIIDAQASFAHGQVYVALSRCKTLEGMVLSTPINESSIINDHTVSGFTQQIEQNQPDKEQLHSAKIAYQHELLKELFNFGALRYRTVGIEKVITENASIIPAPTQALYRNILLPLQQEIINVAGKFQIQMEQLLRRQPDVEQNSALQERIGKAAAHFSEKIKTIILDVIDKADLDLDNRAVKKQLNEAVSRLEDEARIKQAGLNACRSGFRMSDLLQAKAVAAIEKAKPKAVRKFEVSENSEIENPALFERLREWRKERADELGKPAYLIFSQKALYALTQFLPTDRKSLLQINGFGPVKANQFGKEILEIIREYLNSDR